MEDGLNYNDQISNKNVYSSVHCTHNWTKLKSQWSQRETTTESHEVEWLYIRT